MVPRIGCVRLLFACFLAGAWLAGISGLAGEASAAPACEFDPARRDDNYCDCPLTGEDEPSTGACSPLGTFKCKDRNVLVAASRVRDGVCDCCDGSDEDPGACANTCEELDRIERERLAETKARKELGEKAFLSLLQEVKTQACKSGEKSESDKEPAPITFEQVEEAERAVKSLEKVYEAETRKIQIESLNLKKLTREQLEEVVVDLATKMSSGSDAERLVQAYFPCFSDQSEDNADEGAEYGIEEEEKDNDKKDQPPSDDCPEVLWTDELPPPSSELTESRAKAESLRARYDSLTDPNIEENQAEYDYGPASIWVALKNKCFTLKKDKYEYKLCVMNEFKQDHTSLGRFKRWGKKFDQMDFDNGDRCFSPAVPRSIRVIVECGAENALLDVSEPSTCVYEALFRTPAACVPDNIAAIEQEMCSAV